MVVLTGLAEESAGLAAVAAGAQDYLIKGQAPPDVFGRAIRYATQRKHVELASAALQRSALQEAENARLERALLPTPLIRTGTFDVVARYRPGRAMPCWAATSTTSSRPRTASCTRIGDVADTVRPRPPWGSACGWPGGPWCWRVAAPPALLGLLEQLLMAEREDDHLFATLTHLVFRPDRQSVRVLRQAIRGCCCARPGHVQLVGGPVARAVGLESGQRWQEEHLPLPPDAAWSSLPTACSRAGRARATSASVRKDCWPWPASLATLPPSGFVDTLMDTDRGSGRPLQRARRRRRHRPPRLEGSTVTAPERRPPAPGSGPR